MCMELRRSVTNTCCCWSHRREVTMRSSSITKVLAKRMLQFYRILRQRCLMVFNRTMPCAAWARCRFALCKLQWKPCCRFTLTSGGYRLARGLVAPGSSVCCFTMLQAVHSKLSKSNHACLACHKPGKGLLDSVLLMQHGPHAQPKVVLMHSVRLCTSLALVFPV